MSQISAITPQIVPSEPSEELHQPAPPPQVDNIDCPSPHEHPGEPNRVEVLEEAFEGDPSIKVTARTKDCRSEVSLWKSPEEDARCIRILSSSNLNFEALEVRSDKGWCGIGSLEPTTPALILYNVWVGYDSPTLENLVRLDLDCNTRLHEQGQFAYTGEWLLAMLSKAKNLEHCNIRLEDARISGSHPRCPSEVKLERLKGFEVFHHWAQIRTLFSRLTLPETATVNISTTVDGSDDALAKVAFPPEWPSGKQAWGQRKLRLRVSEESVIYNIGDNHTVTVKRGPGVPVPPVIGGHGNPEGTLKELDVSFADGLEGFGSQWWDEILRVNPELESLAISHGKIKGLCDALSDQSELGGSRYTRCPKLQRLEIRDEDYSAGGALPAVVQMLSRRKELGCPFMQNRFCWNGRS